jgi:hypothetical protein
LSTRKRHWQLIHVLFDAGEDRRDRQGRTVPLAIGRWDNKPVLAMRWNGSPKNRLGNPQSRGLPAWFIVPDQHVRQILATEQYGFPEAKLKVAPGFCRERPAQVTCEWRIRRSFE